jgi:F0F1-type ATP synthase membrane subunit b/b'
MPPNTLNLILFLAATVLSVIGFFLVRTLQNIEKTLDEHTNKHEQHYKHRSSMERQLSEIEKQVAINANSNKYLQELVNHKLQAIEKGQENLHKDAVERISEQSELLKILMKQKTN